MDELCIEKFDEKDLISSDETYACSQGMFGDNSEDSSKPLEMGGYIMNEEKSEEGFYNLNDDEEYIFIRLLKTNYKSALDPTNILGKGINLVDRPVKKTNIIYNHASISINLRDEFYGLTLDPDKPYDLKKESILKPTKNKLLDSGVQNTSKFIVYGIKVKKSEYANIKKFLNDGLKNKELTYSLFQLPFIGMNAFKSKIKANFIDKIFKMSTESEKEDTANKILEKYDSMFVCSTFVSYVIWKFTSIGKTMDKNNIKYGSCTPDDIVNKIPSTHFLFAGNWVEYNYKALEFISNNESFSKYFKKEENK